MFPRMHGIVSQVGVTAPPPEPEFSPDDISGLRVWLDASDEDTIEDTAGAVTKWTSKDANAREFVQASGSLQPTTGASTRNGLNVVDFAADYLTSNAAASTWKFLHDGTVHYVFAVAKFGVSSTHGQNYALLGTNATQSANIGAYLGQLDAGSLHQRLTHVVSRGVSGSSNNPVNNTNNNNSLPSNVFEVFRLYARPGHATANERSRFAVSGGSEIATNTSTMTPSTGNPSFTLQIGAAGNGALVFTGGVGEILVYERDMSSDEIEDVKTYLAAKWDIELA